MKTAMIAFASAMFIAPAALASFEDVKENYVQSAFTDADADWRRLTVNRLSACGSFGANDTRRIDVLIDQYEALGKAMQSGNDAHASKAAHSLYNTIDSNTRFETCWNKISRKVGISGNFKRELKKL